ncbi:DUF3800 domain-containing protein [Rhizobium sp. 9T]|uniref:DUF3800 domain-containing protein n=1 Tax=Rhizobium croatiense TaxID=2867516 RepID=UPI001C93700B|nr:DUF3800 domain-containing protein [Rhizobium croatiense]MBY4611619.1 DUF3800 domain-containing protein [Rhizobium croatiense]
MLRIYIDDSGKSDHSPVLVLAGYLSDNVRWTDLESEWRAILADQKMTKFHAAEAWRGAYGSGLKAPLVRDSAFVKLLNCITSHVDYAFAVSIPFESHDHWFQPKQFPELPSLRIYSMAFYGLMTQIHQYLYKRHFDKPVELIFDEQGGESTARVLSGMKEFRRLASTDFPGLNVSTPSFKSDDGCPGLQAADMLAWLLRRDAYNAAGQVDRTQTAEALMLGEAVSMPSTIKIWSDDDLRLAAESVANALR